ncbi:MAG: AAA-like domain-containing protein [bacterium]
MKKEFNITGTCIKEEHYMVDISDKIKPIMELIKKGKYFIINKPRQYGKTTTFHQIWKCLEKTDEYLPIKLSFEGIGDEIFEDPKIFCPKFMEFMGESLTVKKRGLSEIFTKYVEEINSFDSLGKAITSALNEINKKVVLLIDEVDKSSNNQLFLSFLGMLRDKYLKQKEKADISFYSVVLAGVYDVKTLKLKLSPEEEVKYNSPWNIAAEFKIDMAFSSREIETMLEDYINCTNAKLDVKIISERIYFYTSGYPFLVSKLCKVIEEDLGKKDWLIKDVDEAVKSLLKESNTNFDSIIQNIEKYSDLYKLVEKVILGNELVPFTISRPMINLGMVLGVFKEKNGFVVIHNKIYEEYLTQHIVVGLQEKGLDDGITRNIINISYIKPNGKLDLEKTLLKFQEVIKEKYSNTDLLKSDEFLENNLRMLFFVFIKPIINGIGFSFKEVQTSEEKRMDVVIIFSDEKFVVELKIWRGQQYHKQGIGQLKEYMQKEGVKKGYMLIMDKNKNKQFAFEVEDGIFMVYL